MDIQLQTDGSYFNVRSSCIIKDKSHEKVILTTMKAITDHKAFLLPGGRLNLMENSQEAVAREIKEELGVSLDYRLVSIEENIVRETKFHMIEFVFYAEIEDFGIIQNLNDGWDEFSIFDISGIENLDIRPKTIKKLIKQDTYTDVTHNMNYDWL